MKKILRKSSGGKGDIVMACDLKNPGSLRENVVCKMSGSILYLKCKVKKNKKEID